LSSNNTNKIIVIIAIFSLSVVITGTFFPFEQGKAASAQQQINNNNNNPYLPLSMLSTATGTGAAATGIIATVPGVLRTRKQSKCMSVYLLKIHHDMMNLKSRQIQESIWTSWKVYVVT
jgi:cytosine/adenosine deaminase-related metal-dependent hydrolase